MFNSIRNKFIISISMVIFLTLAPLAYLLHQQQSKQLKNEIDSLALQIISSRSLELSAQMNFFYEHLTRLAEIKAFKEEAVDQIPDILKNINHGEVSLNEIIEYGFYVQKNGTYYKPEGKMPQKLNTRQYYKDIFHDNKPYAIQSVISKSTGNRIFLYAVPVYNYDNQKIAMLAFAFNLQQFSMLITDKMKIKNAAGFMASQDGTILAHENKTYILHNNLNKMNDWKNLAGLTDYVASHELGSYTYYNPKGDRYYAYFSKIKNTPGWFMTIAVNEKEINESTYTLLVILVAGFAIATILMTVIVSIISKKIILNPVQKLVTFANCLQNKELKSRITIRQKDELGLASQAFNKAINEISLLIHQTSALIGDLNGSIEEIVKGNNMLSTSTSEQAAALEEVSSSIETALTAITQNEKNTKEINEMSKLSFNLAHNGEQLLNGTVATINEIQELSDKMKEITETINAIAFQTNLLALNASVEAARAGDSGKGFAVVASEVRNLAQKTAAASSEISNMIHNSVSKIDLGTQQINESSDAFKEIVSALNKLNSMILHIVSATEEQRGGMEQISAAVSQMNKVTQQNASLGEETAVLSTTMSSRSDELHMLISQFKI